MPTHDRRRPAVQDTRSATLRRRDLLRQAGAAGLAGLTAAAFPGRITSASDDQASPQPATPGATPSRVSVAQRGAYDTVPLRQDFINVAAIQSRVRSVDVGNLAPTLKANLQHVLDLIDVAQGSPGAWNHERRWGSKQDLICLHEFPVQGFQPWNRDELIKVAFDLPGPESEAIGQRAKTYDCYIAWGCYARDKDWPNHVINMSVISGPSGAIVSKQWKLRNILGAFGDLALIGTTVYDVLDRYVEMYGWDEVIPIARTDIGNLAMTAVGNEPGLYQCQTLKGAEIIIRTVTGGSNADAVIETARSNRVYAVGVGNSVSPDNMGFMDAAGARDEGTVIVDPRGTVLARTTNHHEDVASSRLPIGDFRKGRRVADLPMAALLPVYQQYAAAYGPNAFLEYLPKDYRDAAAHARKRTAAK